MRPSSGPEPDIELTQHRSASPAEHPAHVVASKSQTRSFCREHAARPSQQFRGPEPDLRTTIVVSPTHR